MSSAIKLAIKKRKQGDFTPREREIREALFSVFYESNWHLTFERPTPERDVDLERWQFVDAVIDHLRKEKAKKTK